MTEFTLDFRLMALSVKRWSDVSMHGFTYMGATLHNNSHVSNLIHGFAFVVLFLLSIPLSERNQVCKQYLE